MRELWVTVGAVLGSICLYVLMIVALRTFSLAVDEITTRLDKIISLLETGKR